MKLNLSNSHRHEPGIKSHQKCETFYARQYPTIKCLN